MFHGNVCIYGIQDSNLCNIRKTNKMPTCEKYHLIRGFYSENVNYTTGRDKDFNPKSTFLIGSIRLIPNESV